MNSENNGEKLTKEEIAILIESGGLFHMLKLIEENDPTGSNRMKRNLVKGFIEDYAPKTELSKAEFTDYVFYVINRTQKNLDRINRKTRSKRQNKKEKEENEK